MFWVLDWVNRRMWGDSQHPPSLLPCHGHNGILLSQASQCCYLDFPTMGLVYETVIAFVRELQHSHRKTTNIPSARRGPLLTCWEHSSPANLCLTFYYIEAVQHLQTLFKALVDKRNTDFILELAFPYSGGNALWVFPMMPCASQALLKPCSHLALCSCSLQKGLPLMSTAVARIKELFPSVKCSAQLSPCLFLPCKFKVPRPVKVHRLHDVPRL